MTPKLRPEHIAPIFIGPDWEIRPEMVCLTCLVGNIKPSAIKEIAVLDRDEPIANEHFGHVIILTGMLIWPQCDSDGGRHRCTLDRGHEGLHDHPESPTRWANPFRIGGRPADG